MSGVNNMDYSSISVSSTAATISSGCSPTMPMGAKGAVMTVEDYAIRYRDDGTDPTTSEGHLLNPGDELIFDSWTVPRNNWKSILQNLKIIQAVAATTGKMKISWYD